MYTVYHNTHGVHFVDFRSASLEDCRNFIAARLASPARSVRSLAAQYRIEDRGGNTYSPRVERATRA